MMDKSINNISLVRAGLELAWRTAALHKGRSRRPQQIIYRTAAGAWIVSGAEIVVPKDVREFMPAWAEPTALGDPRGAARQYRYGNLHIREYAGHYAVHADRADPRRDPVGHLIHDAPEVLAGLAAGLAAGPAAYMGLRKAGRGRGLSAAAAAAAALQAGLFAYKRSKRARGEQGRPAGGPSDARR